MEIPAEAILIIYNTFFVYEFVWLMSKNVLNKITSEIISNKYFSIILDCTDITHLDEMLYLYRYVKSNGHPIERFLNVNPNFNHDAEELTKTIIHSLKEFSYQTENCRWQKYEKASNLLGYRHA